MIIKPLKDTPRLDEFSFMVVDDSIVVRNLIKWLLRSCHAREICEAADGAHAREVFRSYSPDIILVDWEMQPVDGLTFVNHVRDIEDSPDPYVSVVVMSAYKQCRRALVARDAGADAFVTKPLSRAGLLGAIRSVIDNPRPYTLCDSYVGPDRRRAQLDHDGPERRESHRRPSRPSPDRDPPNAAVQDMTLDL
jgi:CheY-like chemotaxis protein